MRTTATPRIPTATDVVLRLVMCDHVKGPSLILPNEWVCMTAKVRRPTNICHLVGSTLVTVLHVHVLTFMIASFVRWGNDWGPAATNICPVPVLRHGNPKRLAPASAA